MESVLGFGNSLLDYGWVLLLYGAMFLLMRFGYRDLELNFRYSYRFLYFGYAVLGFVSNYALYRLGSMSFLPWLNNGAHCFLWLGFLLTYLYAGARKLPFLEQFALFTIFSFVVKVFENKILGTWEQSHFFGIEGNTAYMLGWSLFDGLLPPLFSRIGLGILSRYVEGVVE
jgi:hypothetical protein